jgi:hypothetical protein
MRELERSRARARGEQSLADAEHDRERQEPELVDKVAGKQGLKHRREYAPLLLRTS